MAVVPALPSLPQRHPSSPGFEGARSTYVFAMHFLQLESSQMYTNVTFLYALFVHFWLGQGQVTA